MTKVGKMLPYLYEIGIRVLAVVAFISLKFLLDDNMGSTNEVDVLPLAHQYVNPNWIPGDWYLNQSPSYRLLFETLFGRLTVAWGFLVTSVVGRLICYGLVGWGLVLIARRLNLSLPLLLLAVGLFIYTNPDQGVAAHEWLLGGLEAKSVAYGLVLLAIGLMLKGCYRWMALMLGFATSFHVLVGGWAFITVLGWLALKWRTRFSIKNFGLLLGIYLAASAFAIRPVVEQLFTPLPTSPVTPSYVYVFLRLPHHLNPLSWSSDWWIKPTVYLLILALSVSLLQRKQQQQSNCLSDQQIARMELSEFTLISLISFILGLAAAPFDTQGRLLQYYPFRLGDVMLPLNTLLAVCLCFARDFHGPSKTHTVAGLYRAAKWSVQHSDYQLSKTVLCFKSIPLGRPRI